MQKYIGHFDERAIPRIKTTRLYTRLSKRDHMHLGASGATIYALSQMIYDVVKWTCTVSVIRAEVERLATKLRLSDVRPALRVPEVTPATSDEEERRTTRTVRFPILPNEDIRLVLISSTADESKTNHEVEVKVKVNEKADSLGGRVGR